MKRFFILSHFLVGVLGMSVAAERATLRVMPEDIVVTENWRMEVRFRLPPLAGRMADKLPLATGSRDGFPMPSLFDEERTAIRIGGENLPQTRFAQRVTREEENGTNFWCVTLTSDEIKAEKPGRQLVGPMEIEADVYDGRVVRGFFGAQLGTKRLHFKTTSAVVQVAGPPTEGRPSDWCGAIAHAFSIEGKLDADIVTAGDPCIYTLRVKTDAEAGSVTAPRIEGPRDSAFRIDKASMKSVAIPGGRQFTWRVRALKAGTVEFPRVKMSYFDIATRAYHRVETAALPVQVKAGEQVTLTDGMSDNEEEIWPMPDGITFDFPAEGTKSFTRDRALALATRAVTEKDFAKAAEAYRAFLADHEATWRDLMNLGTLETLGGHPREGYAAFARAEWSTGSTPATQRGMVAALARLKGDARAELPVIRLMLPFYFRQNLAGRIGWGVGAVVVTILIFLLAGRVGRRLALFAMLLSGAMSAEAQFSFRSSFFGGGLGGGMTCPIEAKAHFEPSEVYVGEPVELVIDVDAKTLKLGDDLRLEVGGQRWAVRADDGGKGTNHIYRVTRLFTEPGMAQMSAELAGTYSGQYSSANMSISIMGGGQGFQLPLKIPPIHVKPLPEEGMPERFSGAVGRDFHLAISLTPQRVHPGDLVEARYVLTGRGYVPTNALLSVTVPKGFKSYPLKEVSHVGGNVTWKQMLVPESVTATNAVQASFNWFDVGQRTYQQIAARPQVLTFISHEKAATENTVKVIGEEKANAMPKGQGAVTEALRLHIAPAESSPVVGVLPAGTVHRVTESRNGWQRIAAEQAEGWTCRAREKPSL